MTRPHIKHQEDCNKMNEPVSTGLMKDPDEPGCEIKDFEIIKWAHEPYLEFLLKDPKEYAKARAKSYAKKIDVKK